MKKQAYLGKNEYGDKVFITAKLVDGRLSISGVEGPKGNGDAFGSCGQINPVSIVKFAPGWDSSAIDLLNTIWDRWHLNDMNAGNAQQQQAIRDWEASDDYNSRYYDLGFDSWYSMACAYLKSIDLLVSNGYRYGTAWVYEDLPEYVTDWFNSIPETTELPPRPWVD
jgi:hypothetical protein